ncbi:hypothetical protein MTP03_06520 [Tsukamurella sp. PLM1]|nr:hypothetical protein MTP03_06520 [Tsukamurella sp. PLM1]
MADLSPGSVFAGFVIERVLGTGGMGSVYVAEHPRVPRKVALKLLHQSLTHDATTKRMFEREADHAARLDHANIVSVLDRGNEDGQLWIAMQYVPGIDAATAIRQGRIGVPHAVHIVAEIARALDYAHQNGVLHRDVKPANILLEETPSGGFGRVLLADFGIAKALTESVNQTRTGKLVASLQFAAPEQFEDRTLDRHADVYSLGGTLFNLVTGTAPYPGTSLPQLLRSHLHDPVPVPSERKPGLPTGLDAVVGRAMAKDPMDRFHSCTDLARAAGAAIAPSPRTVVDPDAGRFVTSEPAAAPAPAPAPAPVPGPAPAATTAPEAPTAPSETVAATPAAGSAQLPQAAPTVAGPSGGAGSSGRTRWWIAGAGATALAAIVAIVLVVVLRGGAGATEEAPAAAAPSTTMVGADGVTYTIDGDLLQKFQGLGEAQRADLGPHWGRRRPTRTATTNGSWAASSSRRPAEPRTSCGARSARSGTSSAAARARSGTPPAMRSTWARPRSAPSNAGRSPSRAAEPGWS